jgi:mono/diheme cytochrome c family protein
LELLERLLVHQSQRMSFTIECLFQCADAVIDVGARRRVLVRLPLMKGEAESIQLSLEARQPLFETWIVVHRGIANDDTVSRQKKRGKLMSRQTLLAAALIVWVTALANAQGTRTVRDGVFTDSQAARGQATYQKQCASCHGDKLQGAQGPPLVAEAFLSHWHTQPLSELAGKIRHTMPADAAGTLTPQQSTDLVAFMLKSGGFPAGKTELASDEAVLGKISWPAGLVAAAPSSAQGRVYPPLGNMAQLMRGIFFPNSNLIFTVQTRDPGAPAPPASTNSQNAGFSFVDWGAGIYGGWQLVDNAALALADASPLMLAPGIRCENGRLAPVTEPEWIKFTEQLIAVAQRTYRLSQTRNQEAVAEATGDLSDACAACHQVYRESRGRGGRAPDPTDPSNKAGRCMPRATPVK